MNRLYQLVENGYERNYWKMMERIEAQDAIEEWIDERASTLIKNLSNENDCQILELIKSKLDNHAVNVDIYHQFIIDICYSQAKQELKNKLY